jgi:hypothetical protein
MRVFISSTCYDLLDLRAEAFAHLKKMGATPIMSDETISDFEISEPQCSIEACLLNVGKCDVFVLILSQRYGPSLKIADYPDMSATHLEYCEAIKSNIPMYFFVRDKLESEYQVWKKNRIKEGLTFPWSKKDCNNLFKLIESHSELKKDIPRNNWLLPFSDSVELKEILSAKLKLSLAKDSFLKDIKCFNIPLVQCSVTHKRGKYSSYPGIKLSCLIKNVGSCPAFNLKMKWLDSPENAVEELPVPLLAPNCQTELGLIYLHDKETVEIRKKLISSYQTADGHFIEDEFDIIGLDDSFVQNPFQDQFKAKTTLIARRYFVGKELEIKIEDFGILLNPKT